MNICIDVTICYSDGVPFGNVTGKIDLITLPSIGDAISFSFPGNGNLMINVSGFTGISRVVDRIFGVNTIDNSVTILLADIVVLTKSDSCKVMRYLESGFDLFGVEY